MASTYISDRRAAHIDSQEPANARPVDPIYHREQPCPISSRRARRWRMSLGFHIVFAAVGIAHAAADGDRRAALAAHRRSRSISSSRSAGPRAPRSSSRSAPSPAPCCRSSWACSGPRFMEHAGAIIGMPFSLEGFAFFTEAIFLGIYLYGWDRVSAARAPGRRRGRGGRAACSRASSWSSRTRG